MEKKISKTEERCVYAVVILAVFAGILAIVLFMLQFFGESFNLPGNTDKTTKIEQTTVLASNNEPGMESIYWDNVTRVGYYRDKTTNTMFVRVNGGDYTQMFCPGTNGVPLTYDQWCEMQEGKEDK
ncbi:MAG: hypothetical protein UGF89_06500 [Acutalibacteraceae bacterium]|nr:hypothetical protein [Acutalibacteraceae bacterium]